MPRSGWDEARGVYVCWDGCTYFTALAMEDHDRDNPDPEDPGRLSALAAVNAENARRKFMRLYSWGRAFRKAGHSAGELERLWPTLLIYSGRLVYCRGQSGRCGTPLFRLDVSPVKSCIECGYCAECCECAHCGSCGRSVGGSNECRHCGNCSDCCDCIICDGCRELCDSRCRHCANCDDCCECIEQAVDFFECDLKFHTAKRLQHKTNTSKRFIAVEIEVASADPENTIEDAVRKWSGSIVEDGSLDDGGFEINTSPASGDLFNLQIGEICKALNKADAVVNRKCGLHVHVDARDYNYFDIRRLIRVYAAVEPILFQMMPATRRDNRYCRPCGAHYLDWLNGKVKDYKELRTLTARAVYGDSDTRTHRKQKYTENRYYALNIHSWFYRGTIECRLFNGTTDANKITQWGMLWAHLLDYASQSTDKDVDALVKPKGAFMDNATKAARAYQILTHIVGSNTLMKAFIDTRIQEHSDRYTLSFLAEPEAPLLPGIE